MILVFVLAVVVLRGISVTNVGCTEGEKLRFADMVDRSLDSGGVNVGAFHDAA